MASNKSWEDDDGRVIADMSGVTRQSFFPGRSSAGKKQISSERDDAVEKRPWETDELMSPGERRMYVLGALKAALLIAFVFIIGLGAVIAALVMLWG